MKKYITVAALLAAGTAFANAEEIITGATSTDAVIATSLLSYDNLQTIIGTANTNTALLGIQWSSEDATHNSSISVGSWGGDSQLHIYRVAAGSNISGNASASFSDSTNWPTNHKVNTLWNAETVVKGALTLGYAGTHVEDQGVSGISIVLSVLYTDGTIRTLYGNCNNEKYSSLAPSAVTYDSGKVGTPDVELATWTKDSLISRTVAAVPEPSAFGMLAGLGALALVASRRRRK